MSQRLGDFRPLVRWGTTVGDDRETLAECFPGSRRPADAVIVNGGLGPTVDDLSQRSPRAPTASISCSARIG